MLNTITSDSAPQKSDLKTVDIYFTRTEYCHITLEVPQNYDEEDYEEIIIQEKVRDKNGYRHLDLWAYDYCDYSGEVTYDYYEEYDKE